MAKTKRKAWGPSGRAYNSRRYKEILDECGSILLVDNDADALILSALLLPFITLKWIMTDRSRNPLWIQVIGPSGCGKTARINLLKDHPDVLMIETLTSNALMSGYRPDKDKKEDPSILKYADGKILVVKDTAPLVTLPRETRESIFGLLRGVYDGHSSKATGTTGLVHYKCTMNCIMLATPVIDSYHSIGNLLGERFISIRFLPARQENTAIKAIENMRSPDHSKFSNLSANMLDFLATMAIPDLRVFEFDSDTVKWIVDIATFCCMARHHVPRDSTGRGIAGLSSPEVSTRLSTQFYQCLCGLCTINGWGTLNAHARRQIIWVARSSMPATRLFMLHWLLQSRLSSSLRDSPGFVPIGRIRQDCPLAGSVVEQIIVDFHHANLLEARYKGRGLRGVEYRLKERFVNFLMEHEFFWEWNPDRFTPKFFDARPKERRSKGRVFL